MDSSHSDFMPLDTAIDGEAGSSNSEQLIVVKEDVSVPNTNETSPCDDSISIPIIADPECKDLDLCSSSSSNDSMIARWIGCPLSDVLFYMALISDHSLIMYYVWAIDFSLWTKVPLTVIGIMVLAPTLPFTGKGKWAEENQRFTIDSNLKALRAQAVVVWALAATQGKYPPSGFYTAFGFNLVCSSLCRLCFDLDTE